MADDVQKQLEKILNDYSKKTFKATQQALRESAQETASLLRRGSPVGDSGNKFVDNFEVAPYKNVIYVGNSKLTENNIPLINILEGKSKFLSAFWDRNSNSIAEKTINRIKSKI